MTTVAGVLTLRELYIRLYDRCCRGTDTPGIVHQTVADGDFRRARDPLHDDRCFRGTDTPGIVHQTVADGDYRRARDPRIAHQTAADGDDRLERDPIHHDDDGHRDRPADTPVQGHGGLGTNYSRRRRDYRAP